MTLLKELSSTFQTQSLMKKLYDCWLVVCFAMLIFTWLELVSAVVLLVCVTPILIVGYFDRIVVYLKG